MKVLVTGASGFVGHHLVKELKLQNIHVVCVGRKKPTSQADEFYVVKDLNDASAFYEALIDCDVVIHLAARVHVMKETSQNPLEEFRKVNVEGTLTIANQAAIAGVKRFVFISSVKVNGEFTSIDIPFTEVDIPNPQDAYGVSKLEAEQGLMNFAEKTAMEVVIIRPPLIYGFGVKANFSSMLQLVKKGLPLPFGAVKNKRSLVYVENLVSLILCCIKNPLAGNQIFLVSDGFDLSTSELIRKCARALEVGSWLIPFPQCLVEFFSTILAKRTAAQRLYGNLQVDITKARDLLGWQPPFTVEEGLKKTVDGFNSKVDKK
jgi:nucleoside-diphosphate-sugar epimerase